MRDFLFRGKRVENDEWVYGSLLWTVGRTAYVVVDHYEEFTNGKQYVISNDEEECFAIDTMTVGEYSGFDDEVSTKIFEDDIVEFNQHGYKQRAVVNFNKGCFEFYWKGNIGESHSVHMRFVDRIRVIGNIHDNPELATV